MREIVHIQLGQAGNNVGNKVGNQTLKEKIID